MATCMLTGKRPHAANNVPKSMHKTRRMIKPNVQSYKGLKLSTHAIKIIKREERLMVAAMVKQEETRAAKTAVKTA